jgi:hypothetical protein
MLSWQVSLTVFFVSKAMMSLKTSLAGAATAIGLTALAYPAQAATYILNYTHGSPVGNPITFSAKLTGTAAGNVITVTGFSNPKYYGTTYTGWTFFDSYSNAFNNTGLPATVSLDNSVTDIIFGDFEGGNVSVAFGPAGGVPGKPVVFASSGFAPGAPDTDGGEETLGTLTIVAVPEPSAVVAMLGLGLGALASKVRKQG